jgi:hypothetical protein
MSKAQYIGKTVTATGYSIVTLYDNYKEPLKVIRKFKSVGRPFADIVDIRGYYRTAGRSEIMIGVKDEGRVSWFLYEPGKYTVSGKPIVLTLNDVKNDIEEQNPANILTGNIKKYALIIGGLIVLGYVIKRK